MRNNLKINRYSTILILTIIPPSNQVTKLTVWRSLNLFSPFRLCNRETNEK